ncbi:orphan sodium- and chloride-dependent neurotransmitter transporter NTT5 isoform X3 [Peromyscus eremicus]|uniref:orphan sodium- and chloride-dependent neurotransmitter transporter NTT5 isoform X3 n=1 Tax=Peromyscus eremicus TaxID=42410 RepID=UPI0027DC3D6E|nr:orphan sodium- and chloride-dependent neurotransmitter transporter NTT5 isoform X3 [Peromyscus eremicus]
MDQHLKASPKAKKEEHVEEEPTSSKKSTNPTPLSWGFKTKKIRITKIPNHFQAQKAENILILVAFSIGLGSMWRFPYLCHQNGGGSFLLVYLILLLLVGIPLLYMEMIIGEWLCVDNIRAWKQLVPWLSGLGYCSMLACVLVSLYNSVLISWSLIYLGQSFVNPPPWSYCPVVGNVSLIDLSCLRTVPHQHFWYHTTLQASNQMEEGVEVLVLNITLCLLATWTFLCVIMIVRIKISALLSSLLSVDMWRQAGGHVIYSLGLGMGTIITFSSSQNRGDNYIKLAAFMAAANLVTSLLSTSIIFLVLGFWTTTSGSSCVEKNVSNLIRMIGEGVLPQTSWLPKDIIHRPPQEYLNWVGQLPRNLQKEVVHLSLPCSILVQEKVMESPGLAYVIFSQVVSLFPGSSFWAIMFFMVLVITGLFTMIMLLEGIVLPLQNNIPTFTKYPKLVPVVVCLGGLLGSLIFTSRPGSYMVLLLDDHLVPMVLVTIVMFQNLSLAWVYGIRRFRAEMFGQLGRLVWAPFTFLWSYVTLPTLLTLFIIYFLNLYHREPLNYIAWNNSMGQEVKQPYQKIVLSWVTFLSILALLPIPVPTLYHWWYLDDHIICEIVEEPSSSKKTETGFNVANQWPAHSQRRLTFRAQDKSQTLLLGKIPGEAFFLSSLNPVGKMGTGSGLPIPESLEPMTLAASDLDFHSTGQK